MNRHDSPEITVAHEHLATEISIRMVANLLREAGYQVRMIGADVPTDALATMADRHKPDVICLSSTMPGGGAAAGSRRGCDRSPASRSASGCRRSSRPSTRWSSDRA